MSLTIPFEHQVLPNQLRANEMSRSSMSPAMRLGQWLES